MYRYYVFEIQSIWEVKIVAGNWKKSVGEFMDTANGVLGAANDARATYRHYKQGKEYRNSEEAWEDFAEAKRINKIDEAVFRMNAIFVVLMIGVTIVLCVTGNDIVLRLLHI